MKPAYTIMMVKRSPKAIAIEHVKFAQTEIETLQISLAAALIQLKAALKVLHHLEVSNG